MRRACGVIAAGLLALGIGLGPAGPAAAHATLVDSDPGEGAVLSSAPATAELTFSEHVSLVEGGARLYDARGDELDATASARDDVVTVQLPELDEGTFVVVWRVDSADGHPVSGSLTFHVGEPSPHLTAVDGEDDDDTARSVVQAITYLLLLLVAGLAIFVFVLPREVRPGDRLLRAVLAAGAGVAVVWPALDGHSRTADPVALVFAADVVHVLAGSIWFGGLVGLAVSLRRLAGRDDDVAARTLTRFSTIAAGVLAVLALTGSLMAWRIIGSWADLFGTTYGRLLLVKISLVAVIVGIAAWNRYRLLPRGADLRRTVRAEAALVAGVLVLTGFLVNQAPREADERDVTGSAEVAGVTVQAELSPGRVGRNELVVVVEGPSHHPPEVSLSSNAVDLGVLATTPHPTGDGYAADVVIPEAGTWHVEMRLHLSRFDTPTATVDLVVPSGR